MKTYRLLSTLMVMMVPLAFTAGCETPAEQSAKISSAAADAAEAKDLARQALEAARAAQTSAQAAAKAAERAAEQAEAANMKAGRMFQKSLRK